MAEEQNINQFDELCAGYVLGSLSEEETLLFEALLREADSGQEQLYEDMQAIAAEMALLYPEQSPSADLRAQLIEMAWASVNANRGANVLYLKRFRYAVAASVVFMMVALGLLFQTQNLQQSLDSQNQLLSQQGEFMTEQTQRISELSDRVTESRNELQQTSRELAETRELLDDQEQGLNGYQSRIQNLETSLAVTENLLDQKEEELLAQQNTISEFQTRLAALESEVQRKEELLTILEARDVDLILMDGLDVNPTGYGKVVWDKDNGRALLQVANLPSVPTDRDYQLWFIINDTPQSAGVFAVQDPERDDFFTIEELDTEGQGAFAITMEPKGGSVQPTGDMYLLGAMN